MQPGAFWEMTLREWWLIFEQRSGERRYGKLTEEDIVSLQHTLKKARAKEAEARG